MYMLVIAVFLLFPPTLVSLQLCLFTHIAFILPTRGYDDNGPALLSNAPASTLMRLLIFLSWSLYVADGGGGGDGHPSCSVPLAQTTSYQA